MNDDSNELGYAAALGELDTILRELEGSDVDVDRLAGQVARAADLIELCRGRIDTARLQIDRVVADLGANSEPADGLDTDPGDHDTTSDEST